MTFSECYQKYDAMREPAYTLKVNGSQIDSGEDVRLISAVCELTSQQQAGYLYLEAVLDPDGTHGSAWLNAFQLGASCSFSLGYGKSKTELFAGFVYEVTWSDPLEAGAMGLRAVCLDVRGQLMLSSLADAGAARTLSQLVNAILKQSSCTNLASSQTIKSPPEDWNLPALRMGRTDFEVICKAAEFLCYEFYAYADELYFGEPRPNASPTVSFEGNNGLIQLERQRTLAGQCAAVSVSGVDDKGERLLAEEKRKADSGFGVAKIKSALGSGIHQAEPTVRTMAQAKYLAGARMKRLQQGAGRLTGRCVGLPEIRPGRFVKLSGLSEPVNGTYYVHTVRHTLDQAGFETYFEAED